jgi:hypothetical protein
VLEQEVRALWGLREAAPNESRGLVNLPDVEVSRQSKAAHSRTLRVRVNSFRRAHSSMAKS